MLNHIAEKVKNGGLQDINSEQFECGYHLRNSSDWWYIFWDGGFRGLIDQLAPGDVHGFMQDHLAEVEKLAPVNEIWLKMGVLFTIGTC